MPDIFLSYSRDDQATARRFAEAFEREGLSVWWDQTLRSGENYDQVTESALSVTQDVGEIRRAEGGTTNVEAWERYRQGRELHVRLQDRASLESAASSYREALRLDP